MVTGVGGPDYIVDIGGLNPREGAPGSDRKSVGQIGRPWLAVRWRCCEVYSRVYRNPEATAYEGRCPTCGRPLSIKVGPGGTDCRFFDAS